jgi:hypothetical protein
VCLGRTGTEISVELPDLCRAGGKSPPNKPAGTVPPRRRWARPHSASAYPALRKFYIAFCTGSLVLQPAHRTSFDMRNLRSLHHGVWRPPPGASFHGQQPTACCWDPAKDDVVYAFGPSADDAYIRLLRLSEPVTGADRDPKV